MSGPLDPLAPRAQRMLDALSPWEREDPEVVAIMRSGGDELDAIEATMLAVREQAWPDRADDTYGLLSIHERLLGLPVAQAGASIAERQSAVRARFSRRKDGRKTSWIVRLEELLGPLGTTWTYEENTPGGNQLSITLRIDPTVGLAQRARLQAEVFTPVVVQVIVGFEAGFILGISSLGEDAL